MVVMLSSSKRSFANAYSSKNRNARGTQDLATDGGPRLLLGYPRQYVITFLAAIPILITLCYPYLKKTFFQKKKRRRGIKSDWPREGSERLILSVHINERKRTNKKNGNNGKAKSTVSTISRRNNSIENHNSSSRSRSNKQANYNNTSLDTTLDTSMTDGSAMDNTRRRDRASRRQQTQRFTEWGMSLRQLDPRLQIFQFFTEVAAVGASQKLERCKIHITGGCTHNCLGRTDPNKRNSNAQKIASLLAHPTRLSLGRSKEPRLTVSQFTLMAGCFDQASVFTVWRPTSDEAIRKMMRGDAVGKGLDIKGKSALRGKLSAFVPVLQIHEDKHKKMLRHIPKEAVMRVYFQTSRARNIAKIQLDRILKDMQDGFREASRVLKTQNLLFQMLGDKAQQLPDEVWERTLNRVYKWDMEDPQIKNLNHISPDRFGLELPQRLFTEAYIFRGDCTREPDSPNDTGRKSIPSFQDMNLETLRKYKPPAPAKKKGHPEVIAPRPVVYQYNNDPMQAMNPKDLVMAYEENGRVLPVVSDFDCFLVGTRRVTYKQHLPPQQVQMMSWCVDKIEQVLDDSAGVPGKSWTGNWLDVLKKERIEKDFKPNIPKFGYADPKSYAIMGHAIHHLQANGSVRHGAECFNYYFPQDLDEEFLIVSYDIREGGNRWHRFQKYELLEFLSKKVDEGFMFPLNPKWVLCDPGWKKLYDKQIQSKNTSVRQSVNAWYPPASGIRDRIEEIHDKHPRGFPKDPSMRRNPLEPGGDISMDQAIVELERAAKLDKAKKVLQAIIAVNRIRRAMANARREQGGKSIRGASLGKGSLPQKREVIRVKVPKEAIPGREPQPKQSILGRSNSFGMSSFTEVVPLWRSMSFDFGVSPWGSSRKTTAAIPSEPPSNSRKDLPTPLEGTSENSPPNFSQPQEQKPKQRNSWNAGQPSQPLISEQRPTTSWDKGPTNLPPKKIPVRNVGRQHRSTRMNMDAAVNAAAKKRSSNSNRRNGASAYIS